MYDWSALPGGWAESLTCTENDDVPCTVGVPEIRPVAGSSESPAGKAPWLNDQV